MVCRDLVAKELRVLVWAVGDDGGRLGTLPSDTAWAAAGQGLISVLLRGNRVHDSGREHPIESISTLAHDHREPGFEDTYCVCQ